MIPRVAMAAGLLLCTSVAVRAQQAHESTEGLDMQKARAKMMTARGKKLSYTKKWDLNGLPQYQPRQQASGTIRMWGSNYIVDGFLGAYWEAAFKKHHPEAKFDYHMK